MHPGIRLLKNKLLREGVAGGLMSGSGSAVFGIFRSKKTAEQAYHRLRKEEGVDAFLVRVLN
jgi:4-diphosphocytidyl-2C-methyl-D-erythritol kinase